VPRSDRAKGGRPPFDHGLMFKVLVLQTRHNLSDERTGYLVRDRLSFMRFLGLGLADTVPDANTIWTLREGLTRARITGQPAIEALFERFDAAPLTAGFPAMGGQIIDAAIVAAPKQRNTESGKLDIEEGRIPPAWANRPAKLRHKDRDARWTVKYTKAKPNQDGAARVDLAVPLFGYKNHIGIDRRPRLIRCWRVGDAARHDGALPPGLIDPNDTARDIWPDTAYRSRANEPVLAGRLLRSQILRKKPRGKPMPRRTARANARKAAVRAAVEHVFARHKGPMGLFIRTIGIAGRAPKSLSPLSSTTCTQCSGSPPRPPQPDPIPSRSVDPAASAVPIAAFTNYPSTPILTPLPKNPVLGGGQLPGNPARFNISIIV
jgi:IS5 family transposase